MEHNCLLDIDATPPRSRNTHIICTIGPASRSVEKLVELIDAGMDICRLNFSHGDHTYHAETIANIRAAIDQCRAKAGFQIDALTPYLVLSLVLEGTRDSTSF